jgi:hypothetical protein
VDKERATRGKSGTHMIKRLVAARVSFPKTPTDFKINKIRLGDATCYMGEFKNGRRTGEPEFLGGDSIHNYCRPQVSWPRGIAVFNAGR